MVQCQNRGCNKDYDPADAPDECVYHPGAPVFHEGLKSWSCCSDVNKPVLDFDDFMKITGCTRGKHTEAKPKEDPPKPAPSNNATMTGASDGSETYQVAAATAAMASTSLNPTVSTPAPTAPPAPAPAPVIEEDDLSASVAPGTKCKRNGCSIVYEDDATHRVGDGPGTVCKFHPKAPIFHEGSKGYLCCKRRVLEFDEFLKIEGCHTGRHLFVPKTSPQTEEQLTDCRIDHYQTPSEVHVSVFAKKADPERSTVKIEEQQLHLDIVLPEAKRFRRSIDLFGPVDHEASSYKFFGTKVEVLLKKQDARSWSLLEKPSGSTYVAETLTFGVQGRTGTIGAKEMILAQENRKGA